MELLAFSSRRLNNRGFRLIILSGDSGIITVHGLPQPMHCRSFVSQIGNIKSNIVSCAAFVSGSLPFFSITIKDRFTAYFLSLNLKTMKKQHDTGSVSPTKKNRHLIRRWNTGSCYMTFL